MSLNSFFSAENKHICKLMMDCMSLYIIICSIIEIVFVHVLKYKRKTVFFPFCFSYYLLLNMIFAFFCCKKHNTIRLGSLDELSS